MKQYLVWICSALCLTACGGGNQPTVEEADGQVATQVSIFSSKENQKQWVLRADSVNFTGTQDATLKNPLLLLKQNGQDSARVSGARGVFNYQEQLVSIEGNAVLESLAEKVRITASEFFYDIANDKIWSDSRTVITRGTAKSVAKNGVETDSKLTKIILKKHATQLPKDVRELQRKPL